MIVDCAVLRVDVPDEALARYLPEGGTDLALVETLRVRPGVAGQPFAVCPDGLDLGGVGGEDAVHLVRAWFADALEARGAFSLHAAAVVEGDGRAQLVAGPAGSGKSTSLEALGLSVLSTNLCVVAPGPDGWRLRAGTRAHRVRTLDGWALEPLDVEPIPPGGLPIARVRWRDWRAPASTMPLGVAEAAHRWWAHLGDPLARTCVTVDGQVHTPTFDARARERAARVPVPRGERWDGPA